MTTFLFALSLVITHLFAGKLRFLGGVPRSRWLSMAGGLSVAYVFLRLLPELSAGQEEFQEALGGVLGFLEHHVYLLALTGLVVFYGLERTVRESKAGARRETGDNHPDRSVRAGIFWIHMISFAIYNLLIGYLLSSEEIPDLLSKLFFTVAMGLHFVVTDFGLHEVHQEDYERIGRWVLSAAIGVGWAIGMVIQVSSLLLVAVTAFLSGGIVLNVMKEELPAERESRFISFLLGAALYSILLLSL